MYAMAMGPQRLLALGNGLIFGVLFPAVFLFFGFEAWRDFRAFKSPVPLPLGRRLLFGLIMGPILLLLFSPMAAGLLALRRGAPLSGPACVLLALWSLLMAGLAANL